MTLVPLADIVGQTLAEYDHPRTVFSVSPFKVRVTLHGTTTPVTVYAADRTTALTQPLSIPMDDRVPLCFVDPTLALDLQILTATGWVTVSVTETGAGVTSFNGRAGAVLPQTGDYTAAQVGADAAGLSAAETTRATAAESTNATAIATETTRATAAEALKAQDTTPTAVLTGAQSILVGQQLRLDVSSASASGTLPTAPPDKTRCAIKVTKVNATPGTFTATLLTGGADTFSGGGTSVVMKALGEGRTVEYRAADTTWTTQSTDTPFAALGAPRTGSDNTIGGPGGTALTSSVVIDTAVQTITNKRITRRVVAVTQSATPAINTDTTDVASITGLAQAITSMSTNLTGTPTDGQLLMVRITDNGTAQAITWGASFESSTIALPTTTSVSTLLMVGFIWNTVTGKWRCIAVA